MKTRFGEGDGLNAMRAALDEWVGNGCAAEPDSLDGSMTEVGSAYTRQVDRVRGYELPIR
ncbi:hypothetical protein MGN01_34890 [Methylobacterium gnaphalii]|uniref:Uncharacterized protein n=1 Tax=Methylobacterium gnaphalii TaxID=1010610 RepID=A0A512JNW1_9HYPH|nr:hypothetical protein MGN01_34890 [Methylobacterium gnaphalii]GLS49093.1 hypothetical protein GCM10007885_19410 [Methylobacterium gnaphalii]